MNTMLWRKWKFLARILPDFNGTHCVCMQEPALHTYERGRMFTRDRVAGQSQGLWPRGVVERKHPFSPFLSSWYVIVGHPPITTETSPQGARSIEVKTCERSVAESLEGRKREPGGRARREWRLVEESCGVPVLGEF